ncbi:hypothetical protein V1264_011588 [Littorina saxatilis]|uniref:Uncharacterized protein n=1 Tax=Littorina saxatilis TaxID=31220 RepID=A0AAN9BVD3_9CAEN
MSMPELSFSCSVSDDWITESGSINDYLSPVAKVGPGGQEEQQQNIKMRCPSINVSRILRHRPATAAEKNTSNYLVQRASILNDVARWFDEKQHAPEWSHFFATAENPKTSEAKMLKIKKTWKAFNFDAKTLHRACKRMATLGLEILKLLRGMFAQAK